MSVIFEIFIFHEKQK